MALSFVTWEGDPFVAQGDPDHIFRATHPRFEPEPIIVGEYITDDRFVPSYGKQLAAWTLFCAAKAVNRRLRFTCSTSGTPWEVVLVEMV
jgi:hypothetical protein